MTDADRGKQCFNLLCLYKPWCNLLELKDGCDSFIEAYTKAADGMMSSSEMIKHQKRIDDLQSMLQQCQQWKENAEREDADKVKQITEEEQRTRLEQYIHDFTDGLDTSEDIEQDSQDMENLMKNEEQYAIYKMIIDELSHQDVHENNDVNCPCKEKLCDPIRIRVLAKAGTGKSFLIRILTRQITRKYGKFDKDKKLLKPVVLLVAPTGLAALNIKGVTAHKAFKIPVMSGHLQPLSEDIMKPLQVALSNVRLIIWDEIGMSSSAVMAIASMRLNQLHPELQNEDNVRLSSFGGMNMLLLGDLLQIQPVKGAFPFQVNKANNGPIKGITIDKDLWNHFHDMPLTKSQRQKNVEFVDLADDVRYGNCSDKHQQMLKDRIVPGLSANSKPEHIAEVLLRNMPDDGMCLVSHKDLANNINLNVMRKKGIAKVEIPANDFTEKGVIRKLTIDKAEKVVENDTGLMTKLIIGIGAKVMLLFDKGEGLVHMAQLVL